MLAARLSAAGLPLTRAPNRRPFDEDNAMAKTKRRRWSSKNTHSSTPPVEGDSTRRQVMELARLRIDDEAIGRLFFPPLPSWKVREIYGEDLAKCRQEYLLSFGRKLKD